jgi:hypothetical protein
VRFHMTEAEWLKCDGLGSMLGFVHGKSSDRKLRLFAVGCCRQIWRRIKPGHCRQAVETSESFADGGVTDKKLQKAGRLAADAVSLLEMEAQTFMRLGKYAERDASRAAEAACRKELSPWTVVCWAKEAIRFTQERAKDQCFLLRDCLGPCLFRTIKAGDLWLCWNDGAIRKMAQHIYDDRAFDRLPLLADALEDAGCTDADILAHCRSGGEHVRGCWVVDLLLGKE